ncbi:MAG: hypothetical protein A2031_07660 [Deltaproteobacteria bacterium RBG_19FT_COMBO_43_11]|nr:MAG: hypothetical protein A2031_07660 [Deltaproteobacteria bacterium RBG_19FT_COMBO_43_11]
MLYIALLHYPVVNKEGQVVTTAIANMDIHDIARAARTYDVKAFYIVNPIESQRNFAHEIIRHWRKGYGASFNLFRKEAFELVKIKKNLDEVLTEIKSETGCMPRTIVTGANLKDRLLTFGELKYFLRNDALPYLLIFGTGSGIADEVVKKVDFRLEPIKGVGDYNHLAVRSAAAIILDKITSN